MKYLSNLSELPLPLPLYSKVARLNKVAFVFKTAGRGNYNSQQGRRVKFTPSTKCTMHKYSAYMSVNVVQKYFLFQLARQFLVANTGMVSKQNANRQKR